MTERDGVMERTGKLGKLDSPRRMAELQPEWVLDCLGVSGSRVVCDIGAGSGVFTLAAARRTAGSVYAVETDGAILAVLAQRAEAAGLHTVRPLCVSAYAYDIPDHSVDVALLVTVLHEVDNRDALLAELGRILCGQGRVCVIEFRKEQTPMGPPVSCRLGEDDVDGIFGAAAFVRVDSFALSGNFYGLVYARQGNNA